MTPKVSIVIPVYNGSNYLKEAIDSALAQTYKNIEIIVVNDGSNDNGATEKIAKSYGKKIRYFKKQNGGVATALNLGIEKMTGEYFSWLSHDDMYYPEKIEKQVGFLKDVEDKNVVLYSNYSILRGKALTPVMHNHEMLVRKMKYSLLRGCVNGITVLVPKRILNEVGQFNKDLRCVQDYDYWLRIQKKYKFIHMEDVLSVTRLHSSQDSLSDIAKKEGNTLWIDMMANLSQSEKQKYEGTEYNFYLEMTRFLKDTPYLEALKFSEFKSTELKEIYSRYTLNKKVSIVMPFFNRVDQTIIAINSIINQTYKNIEVILVNDASSVNIEKINSLIKKHKNIKIINASKNGGPATARNLGIKHATGDYIAFLDSDDEFLPNKIEVQLKKMVQLNPIFSYTSYIRRSSSQDIIMRSPNFNGIVVPSIISNCPIATPTVMVDREFLINNNILFNEKMRAGEDTCFWLRIAEFSEMLFIDEPLSIVNVDNQSHSIDLSKSIIGIKNILSFLFNDDYYSNYKYEISIIAKVYSNMCQEYNFYNKNKLSYLNYSVNGTNEEKNIIKLIRSSLPYRLLRKIYRVLKKP